MPVDTATLRIFEPYPGIFAYYDGRIPGKRLYSSEPNWLDDGAYSLGAASYAIVSGEQALVYDTHMSLLHAQAVRNHLDSLGVTTIRVVLSHWHADHVAGNAVFADCEIIALDLTAQAMQANRARLETRSPPISPLVMPNQLFSGSMTLEIGPRKIELHHFDIHSADGNILWLPDEKLLLAGDTLEDTITYISEPENIATHIRELTRMRTWPIHRILPNHGDADRIATGGYPPSLIDANRRYLERLLVPEELAKAETSSLEDFISEDQASGGVAYFEPYERVHRTNIAAVKATALKS
jgi:glyoxylase-like metal-dependent hydrolase (beta-lactamase superfamily II)